MNLRVIDVTPDAQDAVADWLSGYNHNRRKMALRHITPRVESVKASKYQLPGAGKKSETTFNNFGENGAIPRITAMPEVE